MGGQLRASNDMSTLPATITPAMARRIEIWPTARLVPYARNARTHSPEQVAQIAASIVEFGFTNPILVDSMDGIIAGHGRLLAARKLGLAEVPVVVLPPQRNATPSIHHRGQPAGHERRMG